MVNISIPQHDAANTVFLDRVIFHSTYINGTVFFRYHLTRKPFFPFALTPKSPLKLQNVTLMAFFFSLYHIFQTNCIFAKRKYYHRLFPLEKQILALMFTPALTLNLGIPSKMSAFCSLSFALFACLKKVVTFTSYSEHSRRNEPPLRSVVGKHIAFIRWLNWLKYMTEKK